MKKKPPTRISGERSRSRTPFDLNDIAPEWVFWATLRSWLKSKRVGLKGLNSRWELWEKTEPKRLFLNRISVLAMSEPGYGGAGAFLADAYAMSPDLALESLLFLRNEYLRRNTVQCRLLKNVVLQDSMLRETKAGAEQLRKKSHTSFERRIRKTMRDARADFEKRYGNSASPTACDEQPCAARSGA